MRELFKVAKMSLHRHPAFIPALVFGLVGLSFALPLPAAIVKKPVPQPVAHTRGRCTGGYPCTACTTCGYCEYCNGGGGKCSVCAPKP